jgi:CRP/FNR family transcriptional regulator, cyclic AMP receptor protein
MSEPTSQAPTASSLRSFGLFGALSEETLEVFAQTLALYPVARREIVFHEGDEAHELFLILEGEVEVVKTTPLGLELRLSRMTAGQWFGDMSLLDVHRRFATVRAATDARLLRLTARDLDALYRRDLKSYTLLILNLARETSRRLRAVDEVVFEMVSKLRDQHLGCG